MDFLRKLTGQAIIRIWFASLIPFFYFLFDGLRGNRPVSDALIFLFGFSLILGLVGGLVIGAIKAIDEGFN
jgi:hypothetical protein